MVVLVVGERGEAAAVVERNASVVSFTAGYTTWLARLKQSPHTMTVTYFTHPKGTLDRWLIFNAQMGCLFASFFFYCYLSSYNRRRLSVESACVSLFLVFHCINEYISLDLFHDGYIKLKHVTSQHHINISTSSTLSLIKNTGKKWLKKNPQLHKNYLQNIRTVNFQHCFNPHTLELGPEIKLYTTDEWAKTMLHTTCHHRDSLETNDQCNRNVWQTQTLWFHTSVWALEEFQGQSDIPEATAHFGRGRCAQEWSRFVDNCRIAVNSDDKKQKTSKCCILYNYHFTSKLDMCPVWIKTEYFGEQAGLVPKPETLPHKLSKKYCFWSPTITQSYAIFKQMF